MRALESGHMTAIGTYTKQAREGLMPLDITDLSQARDALNRIRPEIIFLTGALTHVDYCEDHPDEAFRINTEGASQIAKEAARLDAKLVFYSTEYVFDGTNGPYDEGACPCPLSVYGESKLRAEKLIQENLKNHLILRTTVVYGWERGSKNFAMQVYEKLQSGSKMTIPDDQIGNPTLADYLAEVSVRLAQQGATGIVNVVGRDLMPRSEFAKALVKVYGGNLDLVVPVSTDSLNQRAPRPLRGGLRAEKLTKLLGTELMPLEEALERLRRQRQADMSG
jgi:dTDP-4-dehydrorhamnose reductase